MVEGKTKSGIAFTIDERVKDDTRILYLITKASNEKTEALEKASAVFDLLSLIFGGENNAFEFQNTVASVHDGICSTDLLMEELNQIFEAVNLKK